MKIARSFAALGGTVRISALSLGALGCIIAGTAFGQSTASVPPGPTPVATGKALAFDRSAGNCLACHTMKGSDVPSNVGPELLDMKSQFPDRKALFDILWDEETRNPQTVMPAFGKNLILDKQQIEQIIDFLYTL